MPSDKPKTEQTTNKTTLVGKTVTGYVVDENNNPWNNQLASILLGDSTVASDTIRNGYFSIENIITGVKNEGGTTPDKFTLEQNYPNPFNPHTTIEYTLTQPGRATLKILNMQGREVKTLLDKEENTGNHSVVWDATNNSGEGVASGMYIYTLTTNNGTNAKKMAYVKGVMNNSTTTTNNNDASRKTSSKTNKANKNNSTNNNTTDDYKLRIKGEDVMTKTTNINLNQPSPINTGTTTAPSKPILTGFVYDLNTKYDSLGNRLTPKGIDSMKVSLKSNPETHTYTDENGRFRLKLETIPTTNVFDTSYFSYTHQTMCRMTVKDTLFVKGKNEEDKTYYFYQTPIGLKEVKQNSGEITFIMNEIKPGESKITAFNDTTGIPMFKRYTDTHGVDLLDFIMDATVADIKWTGFSGYYYAHTTPRFRDEDLPLKVYLNRTSAPNSWYADSTWSGLKGLTGKRFQLTETPDSNNAQIILHYNFPSAGKEESF